MTRAVVGLAILALVMAACGGSPAASSPSPSAAPPTDAPTVSASARPSPAASAAPSVEPSPSASASSGEGAVMDLCPQERDACSLQPGTYSPSRTTPKVTFTLGDGWTGLRHYEDGWSIGREEEGVFVSMARDVSVSDAGATIEGGAAGFETFLGSVTALQPQAAAPATIGGIEGFQIDVVATGDASGLFLLDKDAYNLGPGQKARFIVVPVEGSTVIFIFESADEASFPAAEALAQPIFDSLTFE